MPNFPQSGRVVLAESIKLRPVHLAWGTGNGSWLTPPAEAGTETALLNELGRRTVSEVAFVTLDATGNIILPTGTFKRSTSPTNRLYFRTVFDRADAATSVIRELALFVGTVVVPGVPALQQYFIPSEISSPGRLLHLQNTQPISRSPGIAETFEVVVTF